MDTGATDCLIPGQHLESIGISPAAYRIYELADGSEVRMGVAAAQVEFMVRDSRIYGRIHPLSPRMNLKTYSTTTPKRFHQKTLSGVMTKTTAPGWRVSRPEIESASGHSMDHTRLRYYPPNERQVCLML